MLMIPMMMMMIWRGGGVEQTGPVQGWRSTDRVITPCFTPNAASTNTNTGVNTNTNSSNHKNRHSNTVIIHVTLKEADKCVTYPKKGCLKIDSDWLASQGHTDFVQDKTWFEFQGVPWPNHYWLCWVQCRVWLSVHCGRPRECWLMRGGLPSRNIHRTRVTLV